jgi:hypothetical protein
MTEPTTLPEQQAQPEHRRLTESIGFDVGALAIGTVFFAGFDNEAAWLPDVINTAAAVGVVLAIGGFALRGMLSRRRSQ